MSVGVLRKAVLYIKGTQDVSFFSILANSRLFSVFTGSPQYFVMLPMMGGLLTILALIDAYFLATASNKNFDKWLQLIVSAVCTVLSSISIYGSILSTVLGFTFAAGPWLFFSSVLVGCIHQTVMMGVNLQRTVESPNNSIQRMHFLQAALNNLFVLSLLMAILGSVVFVMLSPIAPIVGSACAILAMTLTAADILWRLLPHPWKLIIKEAVSVGKPKISEQLISNGRDQEMSKENTLIQNDTYPRLFTQKDYSAEISSMDKEQARLYLLSVIENKIAKLTISHVAICDKISHKIGLLQALHVSMLDHAPFFKKNFLAQFPLAFQSFWVETGEVEQIVNAAVALQNRIDNTIEGNPLIRC